MSNSVINAFLIEKAFELGRWMGQVDLEEHFDNQQYSSAVFESINSRKTSMPTFPSSQGKQVIVSLRSDEWRKGVEETTKKELIQIISLIERDLVEEK